MKYNIADQQKTKKKWSLKLKVRPSVAGEVTSVTSVLVRCTRMPSPMGGHADPTPPLSRAPQSDGINATSSVTSTLGASYEEPNDPMSLCLLDPVSEEHEKMNPK